MLGFLRHMTRAPCTFDLPDKAIQLRQKGTSDGNPTRMNEEAEEISHEARRFKREERFDQAVAMYTHCLELDCYNHCYSFYRAETLWLAANRQSRILHLAIHDAQYTITLDPTCQPAWSLMIRCLIDSLLLEQAGSACDEAIRLFPRGSERHAMFKTLKLEIHRAKQRYLQKNPVFTHEVADWNDSLYFFYTTRMVKKGHPELLSVDLPYPNPCSNSIMKHLKKEKDNNGSYPFSLDTSIWIDETKQWVLPIPVTVKKQRKQIFKHLMTKTNPKSQVVVLKVDNTSKHKESRPQPLTKEKAEAYIEEIVKNAPRVQALYNRGEKLVSETFPASSGSLSLGRN